MYASHKAKGDLRYGGYPNTGWPTESMEKFGSHSGRLCAGPLLLRPHHRSCAQAAQTLRSLGYVVAVTEEDCQSYVVVRKDGRQKDIKL